MEAVLMILYNLSLAGFKPERQMPDMLYIVYPHKLIYP